MCSIAHDISEESFRYIVVKHVLEYVLGPDPITSHVVSEV